MSNNFHVSSVLCSYEKTHLLVFANTTRQSFHCRKIKRKEKNENVKKREKNENKIKSAKKNVTDI